MSTTYRHLAAIRARLLTSAALVGYVGDRVQLQHVFDIRDANLDFPLITMSQMDGNLPVWGPGLTDPCRLLIECFGQRDQEQPGEMLDLVSALVHNQPAACSAAGVRFKYIQQTWSCTPYWDGDTNCWRCGAQFQVKFFSG